MKKILIVLSQANIHTLTTIESISASMVLATFGSDISILLKDAALSLLANDLTHDSTIHPFKLASNLVDSFEFYDIESIYIEEQSISHPWVTQSTQSIQPIQLNHQFIKQFNHILYW